ncbi:MAG: MBL fold metallo-hydrolase [Lachnospiraceae bacterium]|nr:MBL fold metallo-hydrolase [Lachnospiraceae bacterium]
MIKVKRMIIGPIETNVYVISNTDTKEAILVDPALNGDRIYDYFEEEGLKCVAVFITHGHFDHVSGLDEFNEKAHASVYACEKEKYLLSDAQLNGSADSFGVGEGPVFVHPDRYLRDGETFELLDRTWQCIWTPGHTQGSCCFYLAEEKMLFSGDTLFEGSVGRTDLATGSMTELLNSINLKLKPLPDDVDVFPGHGGFTTIGDERSYNMYFNWSGVQLPPDDVDTV